MLDRTTSYLYLQNDDAADRMLFQLMMQNPHFRAEMDILMKEQEIKNYQQKVNEKRKHDKKY